MMLCFDTHSCPALIHAFTHLLFPLIDVHSSASARPASKPEEMLSVETLSEEILEPVTNTSSKKALLPKNKLPEENLPKEPKGNALEFVEEQEEVVIVPAYDEDL